MTETAITMLRRGMETHGIAISPEARKTIALRVHNPRMGYTLGRTNAEVTLEAQLGDGTRASVTAANASPVSPQRAFDGAILFALNRLLQDNTFVAYMGR